MNLTKLQETSTLTSQQKSLLNNILNEKTKTYLNVKSIFKKNIYRSVFCVDNSKEKDHE
jgi:hypothetical protein